LVPELAPGQKSLTLHSSYRASLIPLQIFFLSGYRQGEMKEIGFRGDLLLIVTDENSH
jgi:hypothetical protein